MDESAPTSDPTVRLQIQTVHADDPGGSWARTGLVHADADGRRDRESNEAITVAGAAGDLDVKSATLTLADDDRAPSSGGGTGSGRVSPRIRILDASALEGSATMYFRREAGPDSVLSDLGALDDPADGDVGWALRRAGSRLSAGVRDARDPLGAGCGPDHGPAPGRSAP